MQYTENAFLSKPIGLDEETTEHIEGNFPALEFEGSSKLG